MSFSLFTNSTDGVSFEPEYRMKTEDRKIENSARTRAGFLHSYKFSDFQKWKLPIRFVSSGDKKTINDWWRDNQTLLFFDDNDTSTAATSAVRIVNRSAPISTVEKPYDYEWSGVIELEEY